MGVNLHNLSCLRNKTIKGFICSANDQKLFVNEQPHVLADGVLHVKESIANCAWII